MLEVVPRMSLLLPQWHQDPRAGHTKTKASASQSRLLLEGEKVTRRLGLFPGRCLLRRLRVPEAGDQHTMTLGQETPHQPLPGTAKKPLQGDTTQRS